jgi:UDP-N-acetylmuramate dehydrogenase
MASVTNIINNDQFAGRVIKDLVLADYTTWHVGGKADLAYQPNNLSELEIFLKELYLSDSNMPMYWLGLGSNVLIRDGGIRGLVILTNSGVNKGLVKHDIVTHSQYGKLISVEAGVPCAKLAKFLAKHEYPGGAFWAGIPGTMGGALAMNAGCYGSETWDYIAKVDVIDRLGNITELSADKFNIAYRSATLKSDLKLSFNLGDYWFVRAYIKLPQDNSINGQDEIRSLLQKRTSQQPIGLFSGGSVFRNPPGNFAARLIDQTGLKGYKIGGAEVSQKHANFIINNKTATANDIEQLIIYIQNAVYRASGIKLEPEVKIIGEAK